LLWCDNHLAIDAAALEHIIEVDFLDRFEPQVLPHDLRCDQDDRSTVAIGFIEAIDEVETARTTGARAGREMTSEQGFGRCREGAGLFMPHVHPIDFTAINRMGDPV